MKSLTIADGPTRYSVLVHDADLPAIERPELPPHRQFMEWWRAYAAQAHIPYSWTVAEPQGPRIVRRLIDRFGLEELKRLAVHFFLDHGQMLRENPHHFAIFASMVNQMKEELDGRDVRG